MIIPVRVFAVLVVLFLLLSEFWVMFGELHIGDAACASSNQSLKEKAGNFLEQIAGLNNNTYQVTSSSFYSLPLPEGHLQTDVDFEISSSNYTFNAKVSFVDNKLWKYDLSLPSSSLKGNIALNESLLVAVASARNYQRLFDSHYCDDLDDVISAALLNQSSVVETSEALLKVSHVKNCSTPLDFKRCTVLRYFKKIENQYTCDFFSVSMIISKTGLITGFIDNMALYHVDCTTLNIAEKQAINTSRLYAEAYGKAHGQSIITTHASLSWITDPSRGDDYALYPVWGVRAWFDRTNDEGVDGFTVAIWADSGQIASCEPQGSYKPVGNNTSLLLNVLAISVLAILTIPIGLAIYRKRKEKR